MDLQKKEHDENTRPAAGSPQAEILQAPRKVSRITFDEKTGTVTLKIATDEEIEESEQLTVNNEKRRKN